MQINVCSMGPFCCCLLACFRVWLDVAVGCSVVGPRFHVPSLFAYYVLAALTWTTHHAVNICAMVPVHVYPGSTQYMYTGTRVLEYGIVCHELYSEPVPLRANIAVSHD